MAVCCLDDRVDVCNRVLQCFADETKLRIESGYVLVSWRNSSGFHEKRWMTRGQEFYPVWHRKWGQGGTASTALSQLVRWVQGKPVLPISTWKMWAGERCRLLRHGDSEQAIQSLVNAGYPEKAICVLCGNEIAGGMDWWSLDKVSGPCCHWTSGCRQKKEPNHVD